jgi:hypothetical protein
LREGAQDVGRGGDLSPRTHAPRPR